MPVVSLQNVSKTYSLGEGEFRALTDVSLSVEKGVIQGIIGFSGAGKTTLLRCISRLERPDSGRVLIDGNDLAGLDGEQLRVARRRIGVVFQQFHLLRSRTVAENIALPLELAGEPRERMAGRVRELLEWFGLTEKADAYPSQLSGGQKQRVAIARALAARPAVLLSDEPTSALDTETTASVLETLRRVRDEFGVTVLLITHELEAVRTLCDRVAVLDGGKIVEEGRVEEVFLHPQSDAARRLLGEGNQLSQLAQYLGKREAHLDSVFLFLQLMGESADKPLLSEAARVSGVDLHFLHASIGRLRQASYGSLLIEARGDQAAIERAIQVLERGGAMVTTIDPWSKEAIA